GRACRLRRRGPPQRAAKRRLRLALPLISHGVQFLYRNGLIPVKSSDVDVGTAAGGRWVSGETIDHPVRSPRTNHPDATAPAAKTVSPPTRSHRRVFSPLYRMPPSLVTSAGRDPEVVEAGDGIRLRPQPDPACLVGVVGRLDHELAVEEPTKAIPLRLQLQLLPPPGRHLDPTLLALA